MAKLYFRYGAMNSGKTTILLQVAHNYEERGMKVLILKPAKDLKADKSISSRLGVEREVDYLIKAEDDVYKIINKHKKDISCVLIDEAQFLEPIQVDQLMKVTVLLDIPVIAYGLRTDFKTNGFPGSTRLLELAHTIEELKTICRCGRKAMYNARFVNGKFTIDGDQVAIDGMDNVTYESVCPKCYYDYVNKTK
jgi:thymidine kinase